MNLTVGFLGLTPVPKNMPLLIDLNAHHQGPMTLAAAPNKLQLMSNVLNYASAFAANG